MAYQFGIATITMGGVAVACVQSVSLDFSFETAQLFCGNALYPSDVRTHTGTITGTAELADLNTAIFAKLLGGTPSGTSLEISNTTSPTNYEMVLTLTTDSTTFTITLKAMRSNSLSMAFQRDQHVMPSFDFECFADANGVVATIDTGDVS